MTESGGLSREWVTRHCDGTKIMVTEYHEAAFSGLQEPGESVEIEVQFENGVSHSLEAFWMVKWRRFGLSKKGQWVWEAWCNVEGRDSELFQFSTKTPLNLDSVLDSVEENLYQIEAMA